MNQNEHDYNAVLSAQRRMQEAKQNVADTVNENAHNIKRLATELRSLDNDGDLNREDVSGHLQTVDEILIALSEWEKATRKYLDVANAYTQRRDLRPFLEGWK